MYKQQFLTESVKSLGGWGGGGGLPYKSDGGIR